jgi:putative DNA primase/helicase
MKIVAHYDYVDEFGELLYQVVRLEPKDFRQRRPDKQSWSWELDGVRRVPYGLPDLLGSTPEAVYIPEGEKDCLSLRKLGLIATTNAGGAGIGWSPELTPHFTGREIVVLADNDGPGLMHAEGVAAALYPVAKSVCVVWLPGLPEHGDVTDWLEAGHTRQELEDVVAQTPLWEPQLGVIPSDPAPQLDLRRQHFSDYGNAQRLIEMHGAKLRYCTPMRKWLIWDGRRWQIDNRDQIREIAQNTVLELARQALEARNDTMSRFAGHCLNSPRLAALIREAQPLLAVSPNELDTHPWLLNFLNGTLNLRSLELTPPSQGHLITKLVHYDYNPRAQCPRFLSFIDRSAGPLVPFVQKALGYSITGVTSEKKAFLCLGPTDTGKTTLLNLFREHLFKEYCTLVMIDALMQKEEDNNSRADLTDLRGARLAMTSETEEGQRLREGKLKRITQGQGQIKSVRKYENPIEFNETHKLWIDANHKPIVKGTDSAIWNRLVPIPFPNQLAESEIDRELPNKLLQEAEGIIAWAVRGTRLWLEAGLGRPPEIESARNKWRDEMDRLKAFREACCVEGPGLNVQARPLFKAYRAWAEEAGEHPMTETMFGLRMDQAGIKKDRDAGNRVIYRGIALKDLFNG